MYICYYINTIFILFRILIVTSAERTWNTRCNTLTWQIPLVLRGESWVLTEPAQNNGSLLFCCLSVGLSIWARSSSRVRWSHPYSAGKKWSFITWWFTGIVLPEGGQKPQRWEGEKMKSMYMTFFFFNAYLALVSTRYNTNKWTTDMNKLSTVFYLSFPKQYTWVS